MNPSHDDRSTACFTFGRYKIQEDGLFGPVTLSGVIFSKPSILLAAIKSEAAGYYRLIAAKNPSQQRFLNGWLNRAYRQIN